MNAKGKMKLDMFGIVTGQLEVMRNFYADVLGMEVLFEDAGKYAEFRLAGGLRLSISTTAVMSEITKGHPSYAQARQGQPFELAFLVDSPEEVTTCYERIVQAGGTAIRAPSDMPWGHRAGFFADPDGNIHEVFAPLE